MKYIIILFLLIITITAYSEQVIDSSIDNEWPNDRYIDHGNGTVTDSKTKLMWKKCSEGQTGNSCSGDTATYTWKSALKVAAISTFAGYSDWRLPNVNELLSLAALDRVGPSINIDIFPNIDLAPNPYWSSTPGGSKNSHSSWAVYFYYRYSNAYDYWQNSLRVRLVRVGQ